MTTQDQVMQHAMAEFVAKVGTLKTEDELLEFSRTTAVLCIGLIEGIGGKEFADGFLTGAINDKQRPVITPQLATVQ